MGTLQIAYPKFYANMKDKQYKMTVDLWAAMLSDIGAEQAVEAVNSIIKTSKWPPTIAEVRKAAEQAEKLKFFERINNIKQEQLLLDIKDYDFIKNYREKMRVENEL